MSIPLLLLLGMAMASCNKEEDTPLQAPEIFLENDTAIFQVKVGKTLTIAPTYTNAETAAFTWKEDGKVISTEPRLEYMATSVGDKYVSLSVVNKVGEAYVEMKISVVKLMPPTITFGFPEGGYTIIEGGRLELKPTVDNSDSATFSWSVNGTTQATTKDFTFTSDKKGSYSLVLTATNEDGSDKIEIPVKVCTADELPFKWYFEQTEYNLSANRSIRINVWDIENDFDGEYIWTVDGKEVQRSKTPDFIFDSTKYSTKSSGPTTPHSVTCTMKNAYTEVTQSLTVNVCPAEGFYKRTATANSSNTWNKVYEFTAAPGQFINEGYTANTAEEAAEYATTRMKAESYVSLGGWGGYVVVGFDHSVENDGSYNIQIKGNSFNGSSEPGVIWVMQDENGDGLPNDTWYELKGSEFGKAGEIRDYAVTYYRPKGTGMPVYWTDNQGNSGTVDYLATHNQDYYYPNWIKADCYTLRGTCLPSNIRETSPGYWFNGNLEWGYADNFSSVDRLTTDSNNSASANSNHFRISDAITYDGQPANLKYIDFVKVATGCNGKAGGLGENSTEVYNIKDYNMLKSK